VDWLSPYKGLAAFEDSELDASFFFGRDREQGVVTANLTAARLTLLYGLSGVGKSSILRAGVVRRLRALPGPLAVVVFDGWRDDPGRRLREEVAATAGVDPAGSLADTLQAACARLGGELYVILDGAEEYFVYHAEEDEPGTFAADFPDAVLRPRLPAYFLLSLREDALAALDRFKTRIPSLYANSLRLEHLDRVAAREAINGPLDRYNRMTPETPVAIEPELVGAVLDQVATGKVDLGRGRGVVDGSSSAGQVETPYLSLVMERLWQAEQSAGSRVLRLSTLIALGGAEQIVRDHLDDALELLPAESQEAAAEMFNHLVTPSGTKIAHSVSDLAEYASVREGELEPVLQTLATERILRPVAGNGGSGRYEIVHDVLANAVLAWRSAYATTRALEAERAASHKRVRRLLVVVVVALVLLAAMVAVTIFALAQRNDARTQRNEATTQRNAARTQKRRALARELSAASLLTLPTDPELSALLALEAAKREPSAASEDVLRRGIEGVHARAVLPAGGKPVRALAFSHGGRTLAVGGDDGRVRIFTVAGRELRKLRQGGAVTSAEFSRDGRRLLTAGKDRTAKIWRARDGKLLQVLRHRRAVERAQFSSDGSLIVSASDDRTARIWRAADGTLLQTLQHPRAVVVATFDPAGRRVATISRGEVRIFDVASGSESLDLPEGGVTSVAFSPNGILIATGSNDHTARIWSSDTGAQVHRFDHYRARVLDVAFTQRGDRLVTAGSDGAGRVWGVLVGRPLAVLPQPQHDGPVTSASFSPAGPEDPGGKWVVTASRDDTAVIARSETGARWTTLLGHKGPLTAASFSPDGRAVATGSEDGTARIWEPNTPPQLLIMGTHREPVNTASFSPDGLLAVSAGDDGTARIWRVRDRRLVARLDGGGRVTAAAFGPDSRRVLTASGRGTLRLWTRDGHPLWTVPLGGSLTSAAFDRSARLLVASNTDGTAVVARVSDGRVTHRLRHRDAVLKAAFSRDGRSVVTISGPNARIWSIDGSRAKLRHVLRGHKGLLVDLSLSADGSKVVTASADRTARIWDAHTGRLLQVLEGHRGGLTSAEFNPDGTLVVTASLDRDSRLWNADTGKLRHILQGHFGPVRGASFSPDGRWIVTAGPGAAGLWPTATGVLETYLFASKHPLRSATFSPEGRRIVSAGADGTVRIYRCAICGDLPALEALAREKLAHLGRTLTPAERTKYLGER
jgi:WD40 repeat protein